MIARLAIPLAIFSLAACSDYHPLKDGQGFADSPAGDDGYHVSFQSDSEMSVNDAWRYALIRAAELAALRDSPYFQIEGKHVELIPALRYRPAVNREIRETVAVGSSGGRFGTGVVSRIDMPEYVQNYAMPRVSLVVRLATSSADDAVSAAQILQSARVDHIPLSPDVEAHLSKLPIARGPTTLPSPPTPTVRTLGK